MNKVKKFVKNCNGMCEIISMWGLSLLVIYAMSASLAPLL